jgi:beta-ureidopropionase / N-carbamoyl-L-amino-acid hydrolase
MRGTNLVEIDHARLMSRLADVATVGATGRGGVNRQALTDADCEGRRLVLGWARARGFTCDIDAIGNLFIRREGRCRKVAPVLTGSHLDTQPTGGNFDGVYGVLAALELLETLEDRRQETLRPIEAVIWTNEEGCRFPPATMGSAVFAGDLPLDVALQTTDRDGVSVRSALDRMLPRLGDLGQRHHRHPCFAYVEAHIEQGPLLEAAHKPVGVVRAIQGLRQLSVRVTGEAAHAGTTPIRQRKDALVEAMALVGELRSLAFDREDMLRFTVGRFDVAPNSPNTVPSSVVFTIDLRHPDDSFLSRVGDRILSVCRTWVGVCSVEARELLHSHPVEFNPVIVKATESFAHARGYATMEMTSGATHDAKYAAGVCPSGMIFVPCKNGISHSESEMATPSDLIAGANVLFDVATFLADRCDDL